MTSEQELDQLGEELKAAPIPPPVLINKHFEASGSYKRLLKTVNIKPVSISQDIREFSASEILYVREIVIYGVDVEKIINGLELEIPAEREEEKASLELSKQVYTLANGSKGVRVRVPVRAYCDKIWVKSSLPYRKLTLTRVEVRGYPLGQLESIAAKIENSASAFANIDRYIERKRAEVTEIESKGLDLAEQGRSLEESVADLTKEREDLSQELESLGKELANRSSKASGLATSIENSEKALAANKNSLDQLKEEASSLNREIILRRDELQKLENDRNLISDEYRDYVAEGRAQSKSYLGILLIPIIVIAFCSWQLYIGAERILELKVINLDHLAALSMQRIPFALALGFVVAVCWKLASMLVQRVMVIHGQRLALARLLVIAKDTVYSSAIGLQVSDNEKFKERMRLKLEMLRSHLTSELGRDFSYSQFAEDSSGARADEPTESCNESDAPDELEDERE